MSEVVASAFSNKTKSDLTKHAIVELEDIQSVSSDDEEASTNESHNPNHFKVASLKITKDKMNPFAEF